MRPISLALALTGLALTALSTLGQTPLKPAIVYDKGGKLDKSFNETAFAGIERFKAESEIEIKEFEPANDGQFEQALRRFAREGHTPILAIGFAQAGAVQKVAAEFPEQKFTIIDVIVDLPNVQSIVFREHEGSYLVGLLAGMATQTNKVGFIGGMDIPLIRKFACGYVQGVKAARKEAEIFQNMTGSTPSAWNDPMKGGELAKSQIERGADVIFHAAGGTGIGVLRAVADAGKLGIGVDSNQNGLQPGKVLTSMLKRVDVAVFESLKAARDGSWKAGASVLGLKEDGVGWALDDANRPLITPEMKAAADKARAGIISGTIKVHDYMIDQTCAM